MVLQGHHGVCQRVMYFVTCASRCVLGIGEDDAGMAQAPQLSFIFPAMRALVTRLYGLEFRLHMSLLDLAKISRAVRRLPSS